MLAEARSRLSQNYKLKIFYEGKAHTRLISYSKQAPGKHWFHKCPHIISFELWPSNNVPCSYLVILPRDLSHLTKTSCNHETLSKTTLLVPIGGILPKSFTSNPLNSIHLFCIINQLYKYCERFVANQKTPLVSCTS